MRGLIAARAAVLSAVLAIDADMKKMVRASDACRRLMMIPGVGQLTALAFTAAIEDPERFKRSRDVGAYLGLVPRRYQSGEVDYTGQLRETVVPCGVIEEFEAGGTAPEQRRSCRHARSA
jgi:transposase